MHHQVVAATPTPPSGLFAFDHRRLLLVLRQNCTQHGERGAIPP